jgi:hypothetical protein
MGPNATFINVQHSQDCPSKIGSLLLRKFGDLFYTPTTVYKHHLKLGKRMYK